MIKGSPLVYSILGVAILLCLIVECVTLYRLWKERKK